MSIFEEVCNLSCEKWVDSFSGDIPAHEFSKRHKKAINSILYTEGDKKKRKLSTKTIKIILIAAILLALAITALAIPITQKYIVRNYPDHSIYEVIGFYFEKDVRSLTVNYVPEGFAISEEGTDYRLYKNGDKEILIEKSKIDATVYFDTEKYGSETIEINDIKATYYESDNNYKGTIFNNGEYIFSVSGNISKKEIVRIAQNISWLFVKRTKILVLLIFISQNFSKKGYR